MLFLGIAVWCFVSPRLDRSLAVLGLYLGLLDGYLKLSTGSSAVGLLRDVLVIMITTGALIRAIRSDTRLSLPPLGGFVLTFTAIAFVDLLNPGGHGTTGNVAGLRQDLEFTPLFFLAYAVIRDQSRIRKLLLVLSICGAASGFVSAYQSRLTPQQFASWGPGYSQRVLGTGAFNGAARVSYSGGVAYVRPFGLGSDIGDGGLMSALTLPALIVLILESRGGQRLATMPLALGIALGIATSGTRAGIVVAVIGALMFALIAATSRNAVRLLLGVAVGGLLIYGAFQLLGSQNSTAQRAHSISPGNLLSTFSRHSGGSVLLLPHYITAYPLGLGVGSVGPAAAAFGGSGSSAHALNTETEWNYLVLELGIPGLLTFLLMNLRLASLALVRVRRIADTRLRLELAALAAPMFGLIAAGFTGATTTVVPQSPYFWFTAGVLSFWLVHAYRAQPSVEQLARVPPDSQASPTSAARSGVAVSVRL